MLDVFHQHKKAGQIAPLIVGKVYQNDPSKPDEYRCVSEGEKEVNPSSLTLVREIGNKKKKPSDYVMHFAHKNDKETLGVLLVQSGLEVLDIEDCPNEYQPDDFGNYQSSMGIFVSAFARKPLTPKLD